MHWHHAVTHIMERQTNEQLLSRLEVRQRREWYESRSLPAQPAPRRVAAWAGGALVRAGERLRAWSAAGEPAEA